MKYRIEHNRPDCIGCSACTAISPDFWEMDQDGKVNVKDCSKRDDGWQIRDLDEKDFELNFEAAESCPVNVIHIRDIEKDEQLI